MIPSSQGRRMETITTVVCAANLLSFSLKSISRRRGHEIQGGLWDRCEDTTCNLQKMCLRYDVPLPMSSWPEWRLADWITRQPWDCRLHRTERTDGSLGSWPWNPHTTCGLPTFRLLQEREVKLEHSLNPCVSNSLAQIVSYSLPSGKLAASQGDCYLSHAGSLLLQIGLNHVTFFG